MGFESPGGGGGGGSSPWSDDDGDRLYEQDQDGIDVPVAKADETSSRLGYFQATATDEGIDYNRNGKQIEWDKEIMTDRYFSHDPVNTPDQIDFDVAGLYMARANLATYSDVPRVNVGINFRINGADIEGLGCGAYIRATSDQFEASSEVGRLVDVQAGDTLTVVTSIRGDTGTATTLANQSVVSIVNMRN